MASRAFQMSSRLPRQFLSCHATLRNVFSFSSCFWRRIRAGSLQSCYSTAAPIEYGYIHGVEDLSEYRLGGYHPVCIDDRLNKRYRIVHKLGHGAFSTAWLAIDEKTTKYVALKLGTTDADRTELDILSHITHSLANRSIGEDKPSLIPVILDRFDLTGPNGTHPCLITVPARCSLQDAREAAGSRLFQLHVARSLAAQLVMAVSLVHDAGYTHGGKHPANYPIRRKLS